MNVLDFVTRRSFNEARGRHERACDGMDQAVRDNMKIMWDLHRKDADAALIEMEASTRSMIRGARLMGFVSIGVSLASTIFCLTMAAHGSTIWVVAAAVDLLILRWGIRSLREMRDE